MEDDERPSKSVSEKSPGKDKKKGKKKVKKAAKLPRDMVLNERGDLVSIKEFLLEKTLKSTTTSLNSCQRRLEDLTQVNDKLQESMIEQETDALQVIAALHRDSEKKDSVISNVHLSMRKLEESVGKTIESVRNEYGVKLEEMSGVMQEKEAAFRIMQQEFNVIKDFRRKRQDLLQELEDSKNDGLETEKRHRDVVTRLEKKFFEEKIRLQKEANTKIDELATKAHKEAVTNLKETTKDVYKENIRMSSSLVHHVEEGVSLTKINAELVLKNQELSGKNEMHSVIVKEKIVHSKKQEIEIRGLKETMQSMDETLTHVVQQFVKEREIIGINTQKEVKDIRNIVKEMAARLAKKTAEMRHVRRLAQHILDQRTEMEEFFMDSLEFVRGELGKERRMEQKKTQERYKQSMRDVLSKNKISIPPLKPLRGIPKNQVFDMLKTVNIDEKPIVEHVDIKDLTWTDKENILRVLFSKMNGVSLANEAEQRSKSQEELEKSSKHRGGLSDIAQEPKNIDVKDISDCATLLVV